MKITKENIIGFIIVLFIIFPSFLLGMKFQKSQQDITFDMDKICQYKGSDLGLIMNQNKVICLDLDKNKTRITSISKSDISEIYNQKALEAKQKWHRENIQIKINGQILKL